MALSEKEKEKKNEIIKSIEDIEDFFEERKELSKEKGLEEIKTNLSTTKKEFESNKYFISIIGGIKTGKSTLINLLCHKEVSKTQAGVETTKIPLVISANSKDKINIYRKKKFGENLQITDEDRELVINYIKGLDVFDKDNEQYIVKESEDFDTDKIYKYVTDDSSIDNSSMIIAIHLTLDKERLKEYPNCLLSNDIMIIDTPGLDGVEASIGGLENNDGDWLIQRTDLILILQSTVSPINEKVKDILKRINKKNLKSRLIHNQFSLRHWIDEDKRKKWENDTQKKSINKALEILDKKGDYADCVDLAMASDTIFAKEDLDDKINDLLVKSDFDKLKEKSYFETHTTIIKDFRFPFEDTKKTDFNQNWTNPFKIDGEAQYQTSFAKGDLDDKINDLLVKSGFDKFEKNIDEELKNIKEKSHFESCINRIKNYELTQKIQQILKDIQSQEKENEEKYNKLIIQFEDIKKIDFNQNWANFSEFYGEVEYKTSIDTTIEEVKGKVRKKYLSNNRIDVFKDYLLEREVILNNQGTTTIKNLISEFNITILIQNEKRRPKTLFFGTETITNYDEYEVEKFIEGKLQSFADEMKEELNEKVELPSNPFRYRGIIKGINEDKVTKILRTERDKYLNDFSKKLKNTTEDIFYQIKEYLSNRENKSKFLKEKNQEIIRKKEIVEALNKKIIALESKL